MKILTYPHESLRTKCIAVESVSPELQDVAKAMYSLMLESNGIGLAANQVGLSIRLIVAEDFANGGPVYMFNPVLLQKSNDIIRGREGCLSSPGEFIEVKRSNEIKVKYRDLNNKMQYANFTGLQARVFLHEIDHLNGIYYKDVEAK